MRKALYIFGKWGQIISANCITKIEYEKKFKGNLLCPIDGCNAKLGFREIKKHRDGKYFYTLPNNKHVDGCPNKVYKKRRKTSKIYSKNMGEFYSNKENENFEQLLLDI